MVSELWDSQRHRAGLVGVTGYYTQQGRLNIKARDDRPFRINERELTFSRGEGYTSDDWMSPMPAHERADSFRQVAYPVGVLERRERRKSDMVRRVSTHTTSEYQTPIEFANVKQQRHRIPRG